MSVALHTSSPSLPAGLDDADALLINRLQDGIPLVDHPFEALAMELGMAEADIRARITQLVAQGFATRFGPLINADVAGGAYMLAALAVPPARFTTVEKIVNSFAEVAHNYARDHHFNMWFVLAARSMARVQAVADAIEQRTGLHVLRLPKQTEYFVDFRVRLPVKGAVSPAPEPPVGSIRRVGKVPLQQADERLLAAMQAGMAPHAALWRMLGEKVGMSARQVLVRVRRLQAAGVIRRIALVPNHFRLGWRANGMTVWDVDDAHVDALGQAVAALPFVSHCYRRVGQPGWPYNLFAMVHGRNRAEMQAQVAQVAQVLGDAVRARAVLRSTRILKKTGVRLFGREGEGCSG